LDGIRFVDAPKHRKESAELHVLVRVAFAHTIVPIPAQRTIQAILDVQGKEFRWRDFAPTIRQLVLAHIERVRLYDGLGAIRDFSVRCLPFADYE
jgi:hypothetical protein